MFKSPQEMLNELSSTGLTINEALKKVHISDESVPFASPFKTSEEAFGRLPVESRALNEKRK